MKYLLLLFVSLPVYAEIGWHKIPCGVIHAYTEDYLGTNPGSMKVEYLEYYHWTWLNDKWHGEVIEGPKEEIDYLQETNPRMNDWIKKTMDAEVVGDYRDGVLLADGELCPGFDEGGFPK